VGLASCREQQLLPWGLRVGIKGQRFVLMKRQKRKKPTYQGQSVYTCEYCTYQMIISTSQRLSRFKVQCPQCGRHDWNFGAQVLETKRQI
jgi:hypothetical protein